MKRSLSLITAAAVVLSLAACGNGGNDTTTTTTAAPAADNTTTTTAAATEEATTTTEAAPPVEAEPIPENPLVHFDFETTDGLKSVEQIKVSIGDTDPVTGEVAEAEVKRVVDSDHAILLAEGQGAVGNALYLDGKYGLTFDMPEIADDSYTISFWVNADRLSDYGPVIQVGRNIAAAEDVTWINFTRTAFFGNKWFPTVWNRNSNLDVWPWLYANDGATDDAIHGQKEWCLVTVVSDGKKYDYTDADTGAITPRVGTTFYLNGVKMLENTADNIFDDGYQALSPEIFKGENTEGLIGVNYWDATFKGFIDEIYVFDEPLTDGQVKTLFDMGNPPEKPVAPEYDAGSEADPGETEAAALEAAPVDANAIAVLGTPERALGWWTDHTDAYEIADGSTVKFKMNNYSDGEANWHNFVLAFSNTAVKADKIPSADPNDANFSNYEGYAEYFVIRADAWGWCPEGGVYEPTYETSWGDDWAGWLQLMTDADVDVTITREGGTITIDYVFTGADGTAMTEKAVVNSAMAADSPAYVHIGGEGAYIELLSVE